MPEPRTLNQVAFGRVLRATREARALSQEGLAQRAQLSVRAVMFLEAGRGRLRGGSLRRLASALELTGSDLAEFERVGLPLSGSGPVTPTARTPEAELITDPRGADQPANSTRLEFTLADATRVRLGPPLGPLAETALAFSGLARNGLSLLAPGLRDVARRSVTPKDRALASFLWLGPTLGFDFVTTSGEAATFAAGREMLLDGAGDVLAGEAAFWVQLRTTARRYGFLPDEGGRVENALRDGDVDRWRAVVDRLEDSYTSWIEPSWTVIRDRLAAEEARLAHLAATGGVESLIAGLGHRIRWTGSAVEIPDSSWTGTHSTVIPLGGRGLTIVPSVFAVRPVTFFPLDPTSPGLLVVPVTLAGLAPRPDAAAGGRHGEALLGRTRAAVLASVGRRPHTTSELSQELGIALSGASQHAAVLRRAGLLTTVREGGHVQHSITELGESLLSRW